MFMMGSHSYGRIIHLPRNAPDRGVMRALLQPGLVENRSRLVEDRLSGPPVIRIKIIGLDQAGIGAGPAAINGPGQADLSSVTPSW
jgi:hypothetical protein